MDLTGRNRALAFKESKVTTVHFTVPAEDLWRDLVEAEKPVTLSATARPDDPSNAPALDKNVRALAERARVAWEEQGVQVLFVAFGWLRWHDTRRDVDVRSPLVFVPVTFAKDRRSLYLTDDEPPEINPALAELLRQDYRIGLPSLSDFGDDALPNLAEILRSINAAIGHETSWSTELDGAVLDVFSFRKVALVQEMGRSVEHLWQHPLVRALGGDSSLLGDVPPLAEFTNLDEDVPAGSVRTILPADSSQLSAVAAAARGASMVVQGPPGTGKSQTIANLIAEFIAQGKTVLFVAEKAIAREVVVDRLREAGLGEAVLHLHQDGATRNATAARQSVLDDLFATYQRGPGQYPASAEVPGRAATLRRQLDDLAEVTHAPLGLEGWTSLYRLIGESCDDPEVDLVEGIPPLAGIGRYWLPDLRDALAPLEELGPDRLSLCGSPLDQIPVLPATPEDGRDLVDQLNGIEQSSTAVITALSPSLPPGRDAGPITIAEARAAFESFASIGRYQAFGSNPLRFLHPAYYAARGAYRLHLAAGLPVRGDEAVRAASGMEALNTLESLLAALSPSALSPALGAIAAWASAALQLVPRTPGLVRVRQRLVALEPLAMREVVETRLAGGSIENITASIVAAVRLNWIEMALAGVPTADGAEIRRLVARLVEAEDSLDHWSRAVALSAAASRRPSTNVPVPPDSELGRLLRWASARRRPPLRKVLAEAPAAVQRLKPCLVMSPLAVAQYLGHEDGSRYRFDACVVDEASMIPTADVIVALGLARQVVISGDSRQMPPTAFFDRTVLDSAEDDGDEDDSLTFESILDQASTLLPSRSLLWHYRSRDESLIAFSNAKFYDGRLITFPPPFRNQPGSGVHFIHTPDAVYGRGGSRANPAEAERVAAELAAELAAHPSREVAITAMSIAQQAEINARIEALASSNPAVNAWLTAGGRAKNLETIQGDECDTMILSLGYGRDAAGKLYLNFGPLAREGGERRLNVAITRARWKSVLVASIGAGDIPAGRATAPGALRLRDYLDYAQRGPESIAGEVRTFSEAVPESPFESAMLRELTASGLRCVPQVGVGSYRVDIGVLRPGSNSDFVLGVECDGAAYHSSSSARDRDVIRQRVLENMGWRVQRVWSTAWACDPDAEIDAILAAYNAALAQPQVAETGGALPEAPTPPFEPIDPLRDQFARAARHRDSGAGSDAIQLEEAVRALSLALQNNGSMPEEDVPALLRDTFGYHRITRAIRDLAYYTLLRCEADGLAHRREGTVFPGRE
ncbi:MAG: DUF4011 domain-containing protein [Dehalococcoidia bacterium]|nr:DUF4011 domain-containing protein [Dehalococcoidia bacterium]MCB9485500.1 DUF4011 domain-containing protein [Thermoflexaceae bacterium]